MDRFARIQAARDLRLAKLQPGRWRVVRIHDNGARVVVAKGMTETVADQEAGRRRDQQSDQSVGDGWTYRAERQR